MRVSRKNSRICVILGGIRSSHLVVRIDYAVDYRIVILPGIREVRRINHPHPEVLNSDSRALSYALLRIPVMREQELASHGSRNR